MVIENIMIGRELKIGVVAAGELFGGVETHVLALCKGLRELNSHSYAILFKEGSLADKLRVAGIPVIILSKGSAGRFSQLRELSACLKKEQFDVLHLHGYQACFLTSLAIIGLKRPKPVIVKTVHGRPSPLLFTNSRTWKLWIYDFIELFCSKIICSVCVFVSNELQEVQAGRYVGQQLAVIHNGIEEPKINTETWARIYDDSKFNVVFVGRLDYLKGPDLAIRAFAKLPQNTPAKLWLLGDGPMHGEVLELIDHFNLGAIVKMLGFKDNPLPYMAQADLLFAPSRLEGLPFVIVEAMSLGVPILTTNVGGVGEVVFDRETGFLCESLDINEMANLLNKIVKGEIQTLEVTNKALNFQKAELTYIKMCEKYLALYNQYFSDASV